MISRYRVWLDDVPMDSISPDILIHDIQYADVQFQDYFSSRARSNGGYLSNRYLRDATVTITFEIHRYRPADRQRICEDVAKWAVNGGILKTNDRIGEQLHVLCKAPPVIASALNWTDELSLVFFAPGLPYWEDELEETLSLTGTSGSGKLLCGGYAADGFVEVDITARAAGLTNFTLNVGSTTMTVSGMTGMANGAQIHIRYDDEHFLHIRDGNNNSLLEKRTPYSSDDLRAVAGQENNVSFTANKSVNVVFKVRGLYY